MAEQPPEPNGLDYGYESWKLAPTDPDAPMFGAKVTGVSLAAACRMRFQRGEGDSRQVAEITLEPRSAYVLAGASRFAWQHSIPATKALRYSITFRTLTTSAEATSDPPAT
jgi:alkylated DNA repair dioxygenase AlkB